MNDLVEIDVSAGNTTVPAEDFHRNVLLRLTGTPAAALDLTVPASKRLFVVKNDCGQDVVVSTGAGALLTLTSGQRRLLYCDGSDVVAIAPDFASTGGGAGGGGGGFPVFRGALIKRTSNVTIASSVLTTLAWQSTVYDTDSFVNLGAQPTRLTVPAGKGITRAQVLCGVQWAPSSSGDRWVQILKNGIEVQPRPQMLIGEALTEEDGADPDSNQGASLKLPRVRLGSPRRFRSPHDPGTIHRQPTGLGSGHRLGSTHWYRP